MLDKSGKDGLKQRRICLLRISLPGICRFSSMHSTSQRVGSGISSGTIANGTNRSDRKIVTDEHCGVSEQFLGSPLIQDCGAQPDVSSSFLFPQLWKSTALVPGPTRCSEFRNTSTRIPATATRKKYDRYSASACRNVRVSSQARLEVVRRCRRLRQRKIAPGDAGVGSACSDDRLITGGLEALDWLMKAQRCEINHHFVPIGSQGFYHQGGDKARFDQQPIEAAGAVSACLEAYRITGDNRWRRDAWSAFNWFLGDNDLQLPLYDSTTGGCRDGLHPERANQNQGAESTLSFLMALLEMHALHNSECPPKG